MTQDIVYKAVMELSGTKKENNDDIIAIYPNDIEQAIAEVCDLYNLPPADEVNQNVWNGILLNINRLLFKGKPELLKIQPNINNTYDINKVNYICDLYINSCLLHNKIPNILGFCKLTGINRDTIYNWCNDNIYNNSGSSINNSGLSITGFDIYKKLSTEHEEALSAKMVDNKGNVTGQLAALNTYFKWNMPGVSREITSKQVQKIEQYPQFKPKQLDVVVEQDKDTT